MRKQLDGMPDVNAQGEDMTYIKGRVHLMASDVANNDVDYKTIVSAMDAMGTLLLPVGQRPAEDEMQPMQLKPIRGGIDLGQSNLDLQIKRDGNGVPLPISAQPIETMHINGFVPVIINITPVTNFSMLLGLNDADMNDEAPQSAQGTTSFDVSWVDAVERWVNVVVTEEIRA